jgi:O-antigen/teichoic acid export membrane protein
MSVVSTIGKGVAWNSAAALIGKGIMFANVLIILTFVTVYEYGFSELVMSVVSMIGVVLLPGLTTAVVADMSVERGRKDYASLNTLFFQQFFLNLTLGICAWGVLFFLSTPVAELAGNPYAAQFLKIISFVFLIAPFRINSTTLATVMLRFFDQSFYSVIEEACKLVMLLICVAWLAMGIRGLMYAIVFSQLAGVILFIPRTYSAYRIFSEFPGHGRMQFWNLLRAHRKWSIGTSYLGSVIQNVRIWIIKLLVGTEAVGLFAFAYGLFSQIASVVPFLTVITSVIPRYIDNRVQTARIVRAAVKFQFLISLLLLLGSYAFGYLFVSIFFSKYVTAIPLLYVILLSLFASMTMGIFTPVFVALKDQRSLLASTLFKAAVMVVVLPIAVIMFGIIGIGVEIVITTCINSFERYFRLRRILPEFSLSFHDLFKSDKYEREATQTLINIIRARLPRFGGGD